MARHERKTARSGRVKGNAGWTLIELVITVTVLTILTLAVAPLVQNTIKRQRETQLREALRDMRRAIDEFHRDTVGVPQLLQCGNNRQTAQQPGQPPPFYVDPRSRVGIADARIFSNDNPDCYPPDLETLVNGVSIVPRVQVAAGGVQLATKKKVYLRKIPIDPMTGKAEWDVRSCYDEPDSGSTGGENVFDVRSKSTDTALNGEEKYSDW